MQASFGPLSTIFQLIVAGHDTTTSLLGNSVAVLLLNPAQLAGLRSVPGKIGPPSRSSCATTHLFRTRPSVTRPNR
jgi:cytochrome P450